MFKMKRILGLVICSLLALALPGQAQQISGGGTSGSSADLPIFATISVGGSVVSATNGIYVNLLQGNTVVAAGNPIFATLEGTVPLPTGASTSALQPTSEAFAGTSSTGTTGTMAFGASTTGAPTYTTGSNWPLSLTPAGNLRVDGSTVTQPVSGSVTVSGTATVTQGTAAGSGPWITTPWIAGAVDSATNGLYVNLLQGNAVNASGNPIFAQITASALPSGAATSANQTNASQKTQIVDGSGNVIAATSNNLNVQCANCSGSGVSTADEASYTAGASLFAGGGGFFQTTPTVGALTNGQQGMFQVTAQRALFTNLRNSSGTEIATSSNPFIETPYIAGAVNGATNGLYVNLLQGNAVNASGNPIFAQITSLPALAAGSNIIGNVRIDQTTPGTTNGVQVNAALPAGSNSIGSVVQGTAASSGPWITTPWIAGAVNSATNGTYGNLLQGNAVISATNGLFSNVLQGNAVLSASNPLPTTLEIGGAVNSATNGVYTNLLQGNAVVSASNPSPVQLSQGGAVLSVSNPAFTQSVAGTTGGATPYHYLSAASTNATNVKATAGTLYSLSLINTTATLYYLRLYDIATSAPTCSSATGVVHNIPIPANTAGAGVVLNMDGVGMLFANGIGFCLTGAFSDTDTTNAATGVAVNLTYK
jgi:hypothetical protein